MILSIIKTEEKAKHLVFLNTFFSPTLMVVREEGDSLVSYEMKPLFFYKYFV